RSGRVEEEGGGGVGSEAGADPMRLRLDAPLGAGQARTIQLTLVPRQSGKLNVAVTASAGKLADGARTAVEVRETGVKLNLTGPKMCIAGREAAWDLEVRNSGQVQLANVVVRDSLPPELQFVSATEGGQLEGREVVWNIGLLKPGDERRFKLTANCVAVSAGAVQRAVVTGEPALASTEGTSTGPTSGVVRAEAEASVEVRGLP